MVWPGAAKGTGSWDTTSQDIRQQDKLQPVPLALGCSARRLSKWHAKGRQNVPSVLPLSRSISLSITLSHSPLSRVRIYVDKQ